MFKAKFTLILLFIFLSACAGNDLSASAPTEEEIKNADYGAKPINHEEIIKEYVSAALIDPESARFTNFSIPKKDWLGSWEQGDDPLLGWTEFGHAVYFGWLVCVDVNAKNRYGGYVGREPYYFIFQGDRILTHQRVDRIKQISFAWKHPIECKYE